MKSYNAIEDKEAVISSYKPSDEEKKVYKMVLKHYERSWENMFKPFEEFNNRNLIEEIARNQRFFNTYQKPKDDDPDYQWTSNAVSPATRNKVISIVAHITGTILYPNIYAQNDRQEEDKEAARVMRDLMEWVVENSKYGMTFLYAVISACVNPAVIIHQEYVETFRKIKEIKDDGSWEEIEQLDEILSGFIQSIVPNDELLIENFYEPDIQKQGYLIWRKIISYDLAERKYSHYKNFEYVNPGLEVLYSDQDGIFFEKQTEEDYSVEQVWYYNPFKDLMLLFVNGVLMTECDNPNPRIDKMLPFAKTIYEPINADGNFFYGKSLVNKLGPDQEVIDVLYQMIIDGTYLNLFKPIAISGKENIDSSVVVPGKITVLSEETKVNPIDTGNNLTAGYNTKIEVERNMTESSSSVQQQGIATKGVQTAYEISTLEKNAKTMLGLFGKMIGFLVRDLGMLIGTDIIQYLTVGEMKEISGKDTLKFKRFNLDKVVKGRKKTRIIEFDNDIPEQMTEEELEKRSFDLMEEEGDDTEIIKVLPGIFRKRKFLYKVESDGLTVKSDALKRAFNLELYDRAINNPMVDQVAVTRDFLFGSYEESRDKTDEYIKEEQPMAQDMAQQAGIGQGQTTPLINQLTSIGNQTSPRV